MSHVGMRLIGVDHTKVRLFGVSAHGEIDLKSQQMVTEGPSRAQTRAPLVARDFTLPGDGPRTSPGVG